MTNVVIFSVYLIAASIVSMIGAVIYQEGRISEEPKVIKYSFLIIVSACHLLALSLFIAAIEAQNS